MIVPSEPARVAPFNALTLAQRILLELGDTSAAARLERSTANGLADVERAAELAGMWFSDDIRQRIISMASES